MKITADYRITAPRDRVFAALTDPEYLQPCMTGCERLTPVGDNTYEAQLLIGLPGLKGVYTGRAELRELNPPESYVMIVDGKGGPGFVRARAAFRLTEGDGGTGLHCEADVQVGGVLAAVGSRLIPAAARKMMDDFFRCLQERLTAED